MCPCPFSSSLRPTGEGLKVERRCVPNFFRRDSARRRSAAAAISAIGRVAVDPRRGPFAGVARLENQRGNPAGPIRSIAGAGWARARGVRRPAARRTMLAQAIWSRRLRLRASPASPARRKSTCVARPASEARGFFRRRRLTANTPLAARGRVSGRRGRSRRSPTAATISAARAARSTQRRPATLVSRVRRKADRSVVTATPRWTSQPRRARSHLALPPAGSDAIDIERREDLSRRRTAAHRAAPDQQRRDRGSMAACIRRTSDKAAPARRAPRPTDARQRRASISRAMLCRMNPLLVSVAAGSAPPGPLAK